MNSKLIVLFAILFVIIIALMANLKMEEGYLNVSGSQFYNKYSYPPYVVSNIPESKSQQSQFATKPFTTPYYYSRRDPFPYPDLQLPPTTIGCGGRRGACMGGSQVAIPNTLPPVNISEQNIAPVNIAVRGFDDGVRQVGTIQKVFGTDNVIYPLYGYKLYYNDNKWSYFTKFGPYGVVLPILPIRNHEELGTNDRVYIEGQKDEYRVIIYDQYIPQSVPITYNY